MCPKGILCSYTKEPQDYIFVKFEITSHPIALLIPLSLENCTTLEICHKLSEWVVLVRLPEIVICSLFFLMLMRLRLCVSTFLFAGFELSHCDDPGVPQFGFKTSDHGHFAGSDISFGCEQGYTLHGSATLKCMTGERRAWDNNLPSCIGNLLSLSQPLLLSAYLNNIYIYFIKKANHRVFFSMYVLRF